MNYKFWAIVLLVQIVGGIGWTTGSPHGNPLGLYLGLALLFPGIVVCLLLLEGIGLGTEAWAFLATAVAVNLLTAALIGTTIARVRKTRAPGTP